MAIFTIFLSANLLAGVALPAADRLDVLIFSAIAGLLATGLAACVRESRLARQTADKS